MDNYILAWLKGWFSTVDNGGLTEERKETLIKFIKNSMIRHDWVTMTQDERREVISIMESNAPEGETPEELRNRIATQYDDVVGEINSKWDWENFWNTHKKN